MAGATVALPPAGCSSCDETALREQRAVPVFETQHAGHPPGGIPEPARTGRTTVPADNKKGLARSRPIHTRARGGKDACLLQHRRRVETAGHHGGDGNRPTCCHGTKADLAPGADRAWPWLQRRPWQTGSACRYSGHYRAWCGKLLFSVRCVDLNRHHPGCRRALLRHVCCLRPRCDGTRRSCRSC